MARPRVYVAYTGGTIGMGIGENGLEPQPGLLGEVVRNHPEFQATANPKLPDFEINEYDDLIDSSSARPEDWHTIAEDIKDRYDDYDGFVIVHGTDTLAYTASALSFMFNHLRKPVVVTGAQIPIVQSRSDGVGNLSAALELAGSHPELSQVLVCFGSKILRGNRTTKISSEAFDAFSSPMVRPIGHIGINVTVYPSMAREVRDKLIGDEKPFYVRNKRRTPTIGCIRLFPGISARFVRNALDSKLHGLVVEAYGAGNAPDKDEKLLEAFREGAEKGVVIVAVSQPLQGRVSLGSYQAGSALAEAGVVTGYDMTTEAALTKLYHLISSSQWDAEKVRETMTRSIRGELSWPGGGELLPDWRQRRLGELAPPAETAPGETGPEQARTDPAEVHCDEATVEELVVEPETEDEPGP